MKFTELAKILEEKQHIKQGAGVLTFSPKTSRFLLQKRGPNVTDPGQYDYFGGGVDEGEDVQDAAHREAEEEGGFIIEPKGCLYPLAIYGKKPEEGLGGYHIFLLIVYDEFKPKINYDPDMPGEVESADWLSAEDMKKVHLHHRVLTLFADPGFKNSLQKAVKMRRAIFERTKHNFLVDFFKLFITRRFGGASLPEKDRIAIRRFPRHSQEHVNNILAGAAKAAYKDGEKRLGDEFGSLRVSFNQAMMQKDYDKAVDLYDEFFNIRARVFAMESKEKCKYGRRKDGKCRKQRKQKYAYRGGFGFLGHRHLTKPTPPGGMDDGMNGGMNGMNGGNGATAGAPAAGGAGDGGAGAGGAGAGGAGGGGGK
jgi:8-oxo-dGTP pyrophosphatase MutT (NUDIX family)